MMGLLGSTTFLVLVALTITAALESDTRKLPDGFLLGTATAAYQIEGAWNVSG